MVLSPNKFPAFALPRLIFGLGLILLLVGCPQASPSPSPSRPSPGASPSPSGLFSLHNRIVFAFTDTVTNSSVIGSISPDGTGMEPLVSSNFGVYYGVDVSPDFNQLVYVFQPKGGQKDIYLIKASDPSKPVKLTNASPGMAFTDPVWSPNGDKIACTFFPEPTTAHVYLIDPVSGEGKDLFEGTDRDGQTPWWSSDGSQIIFAGYKDWDIKKMAADGSAEEILIPARPSDSEERTYNVDPIWSPDGSKIVFGTSRGGAVLMNPKGDQPVYNHLQYALTQGVILGDLVSYYTANYVIKFPRWSPDGHQVVFVLFSGEAGLADLWVVSTGGGAPSKITKNSLMGITGLTWR